MVHFVQQYSDVTVADDGNRYVARVYAAQRPDGRWDGWFVFLPLSEGRELATDWETTQGTLADVKYWAEAISAVYLEGALRRAWKCRRETLLGRRAQRAEQEEALATAAAVAYAQAAAAAREAAARAKSERRDAEVKLLAERAAAARAAAILQERAAAEARAEAAAADRRRRESERRASDRAHATRSVAPSAARNHAADSSHRRRG
jgi:hypothetical protein